MDCRFNSAAAQLDKPKGISNGTYAGKLVKFTPLMNPGWDEFLPLGREYLSGERIQFISHDAGNYNSSEEIMVYEIDIDQRPTPPKAPAGCG